jgi:hypothetical protein
LQDIESYDLCDIYNADETSLFFSLQPSKTFTFQDFCHDGIKSKQWVTVFLACNADGSDKLSPLVIGKYKNPCCFKNVKRLPTKYEANTDSWMTIKIFEDYLTQLGTENWVLKIAKSRFSLISVLPTQKNTTFLSNTKSCISPS